jgi:hypothetical protein
MTCKHCNKEISDNDKGIETVYGLLCESCYDKVLRQVQQNESVTCSKCGRTIGIGDYHVKMKDSKSLCINCFKNPKTINVINKTKSETILNVDIPHGTSTFINIIGICTIIIGFILGFALANTNGLLAFQYIIIGIVSGSLFLGLGKLIFAAEIYIWKNKK